MRFLVLLGVCLTLAVAEVNLNAKEKRLLDLLQTLLSEKKVEKKEEAAPCEPEQSTLFSGLNLSPQECPSIPKSELGSLEEPLGAKAVDGILKAPIKLKKLIEKIIGEMKGFDGSSKEEIVDFLNEVYEKVLEPVVEDLHKYFEQAGFDLFRGAVAGTDVDGEVNEPGCFGKSMDTAESVKCALAKAYLFEEAMRIWADKAHSALVPELKQCEALYYVPYLGEHLTKDTFEWALKEHLECIRNNTKVVEALLDQPEFTGPNVPLMTKLITRLMEQVYSAHTLYEFLYAGDYVIHELSEDGSGSGSEFDGSGSGYYKRQFGSGSGYEEESGSGSGYYKRQYGSGSGFAKRQFGSGSGSGYEEESGYWSGSGFDKRENKNDAASKIQARTTPLTKLVADITHNARREFKEQMHSMAFRNITQSFMSRDEFLTKLTDAKKRNL